MQPVPLINTFGCNGTTNCFATSIILVGLQLFLKVYHCLTFKRHTHYHSTPISSEASNDFPDTYNLFTLWFSFKNLQAEESTVNLHSVTCKHDRNSSSLSE